MAVKILDDSDTSALAYYSRAMLGFGLYLVCLAVMVWTIVTEFNAGIWS